MICDTLGELGCPKVGKVSVRISFVSSYQKKNIILFISLYNNFSYFHNFHGQK